MKAHLETAQRKLTQLLEENEVTSGMYVRVHGDHLIIGRNEEVTADLPRDDRVRLTRLSPRTYGLSVKRHTGRWERTPFTGSMEDMVDTIMTCMQHLVARY